MLLPIFAEDEELIESLCPNEKAKFEKWFDELNKLNRNADSIWYNGVNLEAITGIKCWFDYFTDGFTPLEALEEDALNA